MYGQIPHRLPEPPTRGDGEAKKAVKRASGRGGSIDGDGFDGDDVDAGSEEFRSDFVSEGSSGPASSSISERESLGSGAGSEGFTAEEERAGKAAAEATTSAGEGAKGEEGERAAATTASAAADGASTSTSSSSTPAAAPAPTPPRPSWPPPRRPKKTYAQLQLPSPEQMAQEEAMNNCGVRTVLSGVMGAGLGVVFGIFMGTMDMAGVSSFFSFMLRVLAHGEKLGVEVFPFSRFLSFEHSGSCPPKKKLNQNLKKQNYSPRPEGPSRRLRQRRLRWQRQQQL